MLEAKVVVISGVRNHGENLTIVTVENQEVVANLQPDGSPRWREGEVAVYIPENAIIPDDVLQERGYWNEEKGKGLLGGSKGNRVKMQRFAGHESRGLLFKVFSDRDNWTDEPAGYWIDRGDQNLEHLVLGQDVSEFLGITEYVPVT